MNAHVTVAVKMHDWVKFCESLDFVVPNDMRLIKDLIYAKSCETTPEKPMLFLTVSTNDHLT